MEKDEFKPKSFDEQVNHTLSCDTMDSGNQQKTETLSSDLKHDYKFVSETNNGSSEKCDQIVPEISNCDFENNDVWTFEVPNSDFKNGDHLEHSISYEDSMKISDQLVPDALNGDNENNDQFISETSIGNIENIEHVPETSIGDKENIKPLVPDNDAKLDEGNKHQDGYSNSDTSFYESPGFSTVNDILSQRDPSFHDYESPSYSTVKDIMSQSFTAEALDSDGYEGNGLPQPRNVLHQLDQNNPDTKLSAFSVGSNDSILIKSVSSPNTIFPERSSVQYRQDEPPDIFSDTDGMQWDQGDVGTNMATVRKRTVESSMNNFASDSNSMNILFVEQMTIWKRICLFAILVHAMITLAKAYDSYSALYTSSNISPFNKFIDHLRKVEPVFPNQSESLWKTVRGSTFNIFTKDTSKRPAVIMMASSTLHSSVTLCIAKHISAGFEMSWDLSPRVSLVDINDIKHLDASDQTLQLDNILNSAFNIHKRRSFIIENLQLLHPSAALLFYNYCDNDNAAFKDVMILFTLYFDEKEERIQSSDSVENYLEKMWSRSLAVDKVKPLMSRVANNIVIVRDDSSVTLSDICS